MAKLRKNSFFLLLIDFLGMTIGATLAAFALEEFLVPNSILDGGITGVSIIISKLTFLRLSLLILFINIPFMLIGYKNLGYHFLIKTIYSMSLFAILLELFEGSPPITNDILLAMVYGGLLLGIGVGLIIKCGGCIDGTESVAIVISKNTTFSVGQVVLVFNLIIFGVAGFIFGANRALYSLLTYFITFKVIDLVNDGLEKVKAVMIISENGNGIAKEIYEHLGRTCTLMDGAGLLTGAKSVLYVVVTRLEISEVKHIVEEEDASAFVTISDVSEIVGNHIKSTRAIKEVKKKKRIGPKKND